LSELQITWNDSPCHCVTSPSEREIEGFASLPEGGGSKADGGSVSFIIAAHYADNEKISTLLRQP
jgi:hypothetical protein